jgi:hypothetical protein
VIETRVWLFDMPRERCDERLSTTMVGPVAVIVDGRPGQARWVRIVPTTITGRTIAGETR